VVVVDGQQGSLAADQHLHLEWVARPEGARASLAVNKCESPTRGVPHTLANAADCGGRRLAKPTTFSAIHGGGTGDLLDKADWLSCPHDELEGGGARSKLAIHRPPRSGQVELASIECSGGEAQGDLVSSIRSAHRDTIDTTIDARRHNKLENAYTGQGISPSPLSAATAANYFGITPQAQVRSNASDRLCGW